LEHSQVIIRALVARGRRAVIASPLEHLQLLTVLIIRAQKIKFTLLALERATLRLRARSFNIYNHSKMFKKKTSQ